MKTEKEKMLCGEKYKPFVEELSAERENAKDLCYKFNSLPAAMRKERNEVLQKLFGKCSEDTLIESNFYCDYGYNISVGKNFYINHNCVMLDCAPITFGDNVLIGPNCGFYTAIHPLNSKERATFIETAKPITVGNDVWIGGNVTVLPGVTIGDNVVVGAGSVVTKDVPSNVVVVGNPCKILKNID